MTSTFKIQNFRNIDRRKKIIALQTLRGHMKFVLT